MTGCHPFSKLRDAMSPERQAANAAATEKAVANSEVTRLTGPDAKLASKMLEAPPEPTEALVEAFKRHRRIIQRPPENAQSFGNRLIANEGKLPDDFDLDV